MKFIEAIQKNSDAFILTTALVGVTAIVLASIKMITKIFAK